MTTSRALVTVYVTLLLLVPLMSTSTMVINPSSEIELENDLGLVQDASKILEMLDDEGVNFDVDVPPTGIQEMSFGGFIKNLGQLPDESIKYYFSSNTVSVSFGESRVDFRLLGPNDESIYFTITFPGSNDVIPDGVKKKVHVVNYIMSDMQIANIPTFDEIMFPNLYDGIDLRYFMSDRGLKYEFLVHPGADPSQIRLKASDSVSITVDEASVSINLESNAIFQDTGLNVFQADGTTVNTRFTSDPSIPNCYGFHVDLFDHRQTLTIDPWFLPFSTYVTHGLVGASLEALAVDADGNCYVTGFRYVVGLPEREWDMYIGKHAPNGTPIWSSYYYFWGTGEVTEGRDIELDDLGNVYVCGTTNSHNFPTTVDANSTSYNGGQSDAFIIRMNETGGWEYASYIGGSDIDSALGIALHPSTNEVYVVGGTRSNDFPMQDAFDSSQDGNTDGYVVKFSMDLSDFEYSSFLGGNMDDYADAVAVGLNGYCYVAGNTNSSDYPTSVGSLDALHGGGDWDGFITILDPDGQGLNQSAYLGGVGNERAQDIVVGDDGRCYIVGYTNSSNFPITSELQSYHAANDGFLTVLSEDHGSLDMSTFLGTDSVDVATTVNIGPDDKVYIGGMTLSDSFVQVNPYDGTYNGGTFDGFVMRINAALDTIEFSTYLGGEDSDRVYAIGADSSGSIFVAGSTYSSNFPLVREYQDYGYGYLAKLAEDTTDPVITLNSPETLQKIHGGMHIDLDVTDDWFIDTVVYNWDNGENLTLGEPYNIPCTFEDTYTLRVYANDSAGNEVSVIYNFLRGNTYFRYSTFLGGGPSDNAWAVVLDSAGNSYVVGETLSPNFPTLNAFNDTWSGDDDIFLTKFSITGEMLFSTYIGGYDSDIARDVILDTFGNIYICGRTESDTGFPLVNAQNSTYGGGASDAFLLKLDSTGANLLFSTFLGGDSEDAAYGLDLDTSGDVYVVGYTTSYDFPTVNAYNDTKGSLMDVILTKYDSTGQNILYSTFIGGNDDDFAYNLAIDSDDYCYIVGATGSSNYPTNNAMNSTNNGGYDVFITKIKPGESVLSYSTYLGSSGHDIARDIVVDSSGQAFFVGFAEQGDYPLRNEIMTFQGIRDIIITGINSTGTGTIFSTYLGTSNFDEAEAIVQGSGGHLYITGSTYGNGIPMSNALDASHSGNWDVVVARLTPTHDGIGFATMLGGPNEEKAHGIDVHSDGSIIVVGHTNSETFPTEDAFNETFAGAVDAFVTMIGFDVNAPTIDDPSDFNVQVGSIGNTVMWAPYDANPDSYTLLVNEARWDYGEWSPDDDNITVGIDGLSLGGYNFTIIVYDEGGNSATSTVWITVIDDDTTPIIDVPDDITYDELSTGHWLTWTPSDANPDTYVVYRNGVVIDSGVWDGSQVAIQIDGLDYGSYNYTLWVQDIGGNTATDTAWVYVVDGTAPTISSPSDIEYEEGDTGNQISWTATDLHPVSYEIFINGSSIGSYDWTVDTIIVSVDGLAVGTHLVTLTVTDIGGNTASNSILVIVTSASTSPTTTTTTTTTTSTTTTATTTSTPTEPTTTTTTTTTSTPTEPTTTTTPPPEDITMILVIAGVGGVAVVIIIVIVMKRKSS